MQSCFGLAQVRCDAVIFVTILFSAYKIRVQHILMHACRAAVSVVKYVYTHSKTICPSFYGSLVHHQVRRGVT